eukprot:4240868-Amphidinium_carterae.1
MPHLGWVARENFASKACRHWKLKVCRAGNHGRARQQRSSTPDESHWESFRHVPHPTLECYSMLTVVSAVG